MILPVDAPAGTGSFLQSGAAEIRCGTMTFATHCGHCGFDGALEELKGSVLLDSVEQEQGPGMPEATVSTFLEVSRCGRCRDLTFTRYTWVDPYFDSPDDATNVVTLYPEERDLQDVPERVRERFVSMLSLQHEPDAFAVRAGRCLEAICADQGFPSTFGNLYKRLDALVSQGGAPQSLIEQAHLVRQYRNLGGHDSEIEPLAEDVPLIRGFVEALLEFFYWGPSKLARGTAALRRREQAAKARTSS